MNLRKFIANNLQLIAKDEEIVLNPQKKCAAEHADTALLYYLHQFRDYIRQLCMHTASNI